MSKAYEYIVVVKDGASKALEATSKAAGKADKDLGQVAQAASGAKSKLGGLKGMLPGLGALLAATFSIAAISKFIGSIFSVSAEFDKYRAVLDHTFQSASMGEASMAMLADFAGKTPFKIAELTESFVKLSTRGLVPSQENMRQYGDVAASMGKSFDQMVEAALDAGMGEFERLKEFGIKAKVAGENVTFMFKGQATTVKNSESAINGYIQSLGDMQGVKGGMDAVKKTTGGMLGTLQDKLTMLMLSLGDKLAPLFEKVFNKIGLLIDWVNSKDFGPFIDSFVSGLGMAYRVISGLFSVISFLMPFLKNFAIAFGAIALVIAILNIKMIFLTMQTWLLSSALFAIPGVGLLLMITALIAIIVTAYQKLGWFRGAIDLVGAAIKGFAIAIKNYVITRMKELLSGIVGIGKTLLLFFSGDWKAAFETGKKAVGDLVGVDSKKNFVADMRATGKAAGVAYDKGVAEVAAGKATKKKTKAKTGAFDFEAERQAYLAGAGGGTGGADADKKTAGVGGVTGGGSKQTNITVNIGKLNETIEINTTNLKEGGQQVQAMMEEFLLRALNSVNQMQTT